MRWDDDKPTKWSVRPAKTQISPVWSVFAMRSMRNQGPKVSSCGQRRLWSNGRRMPRLIWVFAGRTCHFAGFVMLRLICKVYPGRYLLPCASEINTIFSLFPLSPLRALFVKQYPLKTFMTDFSMNPGCIMIFSLLKKIPCNWKNTLNQRTIGPVSLTRVLRIC